MNMRDYFAAHLASIAAQKYGAGAEDIAAEASYRMADALIRARERIPG
jgi:hypothetical protein